MFKVIGFFFKSSWKVILLAAISSAFSASLNLLVFKVLSSIVKDAEGDLWSRVGLVASMSAASALITIYVGKYVTGYYEQKIVSYRRLLAQQVLGVNYQNIERKLDRFVTVLLFEITEIGNFGKNISSFMVALFQLLVVLVYLFVLSWGLTSIIMVVFSVQAIVTILFLPRLKEMESGISKTRYHLHFALDRMEKGLKDLFLNSWHGKKYIENSIDRPGQDLAKLNLGLFHLKTKMESAINVFVMISVGLILVLALHYLQMDKAVLIEYLALLLFIIPSAATLFQFLKNVKKVQNAQEQVEAFNVDIRKLDVVSGAGKVKAKDDQKVPLITLKEVKFSYGDQGNFELGPISFEINHNEIVIINGGNGSGKSTLFKIITGLYLPQEGEVLFRGERLGVENMQDYRDLFSGYFTDSPVFDDLTYLDSSKVKAHGDTLIDNLELKGKVNFEEINHITKSGLSHGQRGRLNLLRLLLQDCEIFFLDEWAANQDVHFKEYFYKQMVPELKRIGKTVILISHDDKYYHVADKVITLKNGKLAN